MIADGFREACVDCMHANVNQFPEAVREQLYCGVDGNGGFLSPTYDDDPFFQRRLWRHTDTNGKTYVGAEGYKEWKSDITPPEQSTMLGLAPRPESVPNLFIDGTFHRSITGEPTPDGVDIDARGGDSFKIVDKYGRQIFGLTDDAVAWFNKTFMLPAIEEHFKKCGYKL